jgi:hypothetical protein
MNESQFLITTAISVATLITTIITAFYLYRTYRTGQSQTSTSLAINQFNIYYNEFVDFVKEAENLKFGDESSNLSVVGLSDIPNRYNGINYIATLNFTTDRMKYILQNTKTLNERSLRSNFREGILYPLSRFYDRLYKFLLRIKNDDVLIQNYKNILYMYVERDLLQTYFRVCNNTHGPELLYDLTPFKTQAYDANSFYGINRFFIENNCFQYNNLTFYQETL